MKLALTVVLVILYFALVLWFMRLSDPNRRR